MADTSTWNFERTSTSDVVIEKVLESGGNVVFAPNGSLNKLERIVLLLRDSDRLR